VFLLVVIGGLAWEAILRFDDPQPVTGKTVMIVAACVSFSTAFALGRSPRGANVLCELRAA